LDKWPADYKKPDAATVWRWLERAVSDRRVRRDGTGRSHSPFRYWLPANEPKLAPDPVRLELEPLPPLDPLTDDYPSFPPPWRKRARKPKPADAGFSGNVNSGGEP
jgi:hypothetical protein